MGIFTAGDEIKVRVVKVTDIRRNYAVTLEISRRYCDGGFYDDEPPRKETLTLKVGEEKVI